jgi:hypothetical protein
MVIRKVFHYDKDAVSSAFSELDRWLNGDDDDAEYFNGNSSSLLAAHLTVPFLHKQTINIPALFSR